MKKRVTFISLLAVVCLLFATLSIGALSGTGTTVKAETLQAESLSLVDLDWESAVSGYGNVNKNANWGGTPGATVNGTPITVPYIGTHMPASNDNPAVIVYDISAYSNVYEYFEASVAMVNDGDNMAKFIVLADDKVVDSVIWRKSANATPESHTFSYYPAVMKAYIKGAQKLTLKIEETGYGQAFGSCAWINPILTNYDLGQDRVWASDVLDRINNSNATGWDYGYGTTVMYDAKADGDPLYFEGTGQTFERGLGLQLKGTNYADYEADKTNQAQYVSTKWNIEGKGFTLFNMLVEMDLSFGCYVDAFIDGQEVYHSPLIDSNGTLAHNGIWVANAPKTINVAIPEGAKEFELRLICENTIGDGLINYINPAFYRGNNYLYTMYAEETYGEGWPFNVTRGYDWLGKETQMYSASSDSAVTYGNGLFMVAGDDNNAPACYSVNIENKNYNYFSSKVGLAFYTRDGSTNTDVTPNTVGNVVFTADVIYKDGTKVTYSSQNIDWNNSGAEFSFAYDNKDAVKLNLYILAEQMGNSESVWGDTKLEEKLTATFTADGYKEVVAYNAGDSLVAPELPQIEGYEFKYWKLEGEETAFNFENAVINESMRFVAVVQPSTYNVTYKQMLGEELSDATYEPTTYVYGDNLAMPEAKEVTGYTFEGWYNGDSKVTELVKPMGDLELVAKYTINEYTVTFIDGESEKSIKVQYNGYATSQEAEIRLHYTFDGWYLGEVKFDFENTPVTGDITLQSKWVADTYTIKYYVNLDGEETETDVYTKTTHTYGVDTQLETAQEIAGYTFDGFYVDGNKVTMLEGQTYSDEIKVVAKYLSVTYKVTFNLDGVEIYSVDAKQGEKVQLPEEPVKNGYKFLGWYDGETQFTGETEVMGNVTLEAKFEQEEVKVGCKSSLDAIAMCVLLCFGVLFYKKH